ncbi:hydroxyacid dehydrogenase [Patescibacteria group bacterium]|nr:hydroxyacid dehydrogenase [Patescibacteria group bacterium]
MKTKAQITFLEVEPEDKRKITKKFPKTTIIPGTLTENQIIKQCKDTEILSVFIYSKITRKVIEGLPNLKIIVTRSVGYDHIDLKAAQEKNILVCNVPDYGAHVIAEHVFALLLAGLRHVSEADKRVEDTHKFQFRGLRGITLKGKTLGIIGTGKIGNNVARIASLGFLMNVIAFSPIKDRKAARENKFKYVSLDAIWKKSDIISLHCPLLPSTEHMINSKSISKMKKEVIIVNTARGGLIDTKAFVKGLKTGKIAYALLDVLEHEQNIAQSKDLIHIKNVIATPHIAFYADDSMKTMYDESFESIDRFLNKKKLLHKVEGI